MAFDEAPPFWWHKRAWQAWALWPLSCVYGWIAGIRMDMKPSHYAGVPVICVGNFIAGGAGKTPLVLALCRQAKSMDLKPGFLSRGHGGAIHHSVLVDTARHNSHDVGDEPLLLAQMAPTVVSPNRAAGAKLLIESGCDFIIMDDGFQNPLLHKDYCLIVTNARRGLGNGHVMPGGPLRAPLRKQMLRTDAVVVVGKGERADGVIRRAARSGKPIFEAGIIYPDGEEFRGKWLLAYAGIGDPDKFFDALASLGSEVMDRRSFGDHHRFEDHECEELIEKAKLLGVELVTTEKDAARLQGMGEAQEKLLRASHVLRLETRLDDPDSLQRIINEAISRFKSRRVG